MLACPRVNFTPANHQDEALMDAPIRVEEHNFNISAPHMHASMLEALSIQPGDRCGSLVDVGWPLAFGK